MDDHKKHKNTMTSPAEESLVNLIDRLNQLILFGKEMPSIIDHRQLFCERICEIMQTKCCVLGLIDNDSKITMTEYISMHQSNGKEQKAVLIKKLSSDSIKKILKNRKILSIDNMLASSIYTENNLYGFFCVNEKNDGSNFDETDHTVMSMLASEISSIYERHQLITIINAQNYIINKSNYHEKIISELENENKIHHLFYEILHVLGDNIDSNIKINNILKLICDAFKFDLSEIWMFNENDNKLHCDYQLYNQNIIRIENNNASNKMVIDINLLNRIYDKSNPAWNLGDYQYNEIKLATFISIPVNFEKKRIGIINFFTKEHRIQDKKLIDILIMISIKLGIWFQYKLAEQEIDYILNYDRLTGLLNRSMLEQSLNKIILTNSDVPLSVVTIDIDKLKVINEAMSYYVGDQVVQLVADKLKKSIGDRGHLLSRTGGDKFSFLIKGISDQKYLLNYIEDLLSIINEPICIGNQRIAIKASAGISTFPSNGRDSTTLLKNSDAALNLAKEMGGNRPQFFQPDIPLYISEKFTLINELHEALNKNQFTIYFEPKVDLKTNEIVGAEALLRWQHPKKGLLYPTKFISIAEETGLIIPISEWILKTIFQLIVAHEINVPIAINLSIIQFGQQYNLVSYIKRLMNEFNIQGKQLEYEITENIMMLTEKNSIKVLNQLKNLGSQISFDDFGSGYSSFAYLKYFSPNKIKIDKSFIDDLTSDPCTMKIVEAMISLAHALDIKVIAEGVTSASQVEFLKKYGCDQIQGYYVAKALPLKEFKLFLKNRMEHGVM